MVNYSSPSSASLMAASHGNMREKTAVFKSASLCGQPESQDGLEENLTSAFTSTVLVNAAACFHNLSFMFNISYF